MIYFLYGGDTYRSRKKLREIEDGFRAAHGTAADVQRWDGAEDSFSRLADMGAASSLFGKKKMIVLERASSGPAAPKEVFALLEKNKGASGFLVVVREEGAVFREKDWCEKMAGVADRTQKFDVLSGARLENWIREEAGRRAAPLGPADTARLMGFGGDLWAAANEIEKIAVRALPNGARPATLASTTVFDLGDSFFVAPRRALRHLLVLEEQGEDPRQIFSYLANYLRTVLAVKIAGDQHRQLPAALGIKYFVAEKANRVSAGMDRAVLTEKLQRFFQEDGAIKTGGAGVEEAILRLLFS